VARKKNSRRWLEVVMMSIGYLILSNGIATAEFGFRQAERLGPWISSMNSGGIGAISYDGLELYGDTIDFTGNLYQLVVSTRESIDQDWGPFTLLGSAFDGDTASISADGLELYFVSFSFAEGAFIGTSSRETIADPWGPVVRLTQLGGGHGSPIVQTPSITADGTELYFTILNKSDGLGSQDIYVSRRITLDAPWGPPEHIGDTVNTEYSEGNVGVSPDGLALFYSEHQNTSIAGSGIINPNPSAIGGHDIWVSIRKGKDEPWGVPFNTGLAVNTSSGEYLPRISPNGTTLYFISDRPGKTGLEDSFSAEIVPAIDFSNDGMVDVEDLLTMIDHWGTDESTVDIGPMPWGDGIVDGKDVEVLMKYWGQEFINPDPLVPSDLLAHWALDEVEGMFAEERVSGKMDVVLGNPKWQPEGGQVRGCLEFDGIDDMVIAKSVLNPSDQPFSVFAWIKGGGPGQVILSQQTGVNWLGVNADGMLMTELVKSGGRTPGSPLYSETVVTDGNWHRIGFVWDGTQRILYVDSVPVAIDDQANLGGATGGLIIGVGTDNQAGTFWSGMIDDVRINDRAITP
jgi:hypothetical protein